MNKINWKSNGLSILILFITFFVILSCNKSKNNIQNDIIEYNQDINISQIYLLGTNINEYETSINFGTNSETYPIKIRNPPKILDFNWSEVLVSVKDDIIMSVACIWIKQLTTTENNILLNDLLNYFNINNYIIDENNNDNGIISIKVIGIIDNFRLTYFPEDSPIGEYIVIHHSYNE